jgi:hypothetical protein
MMAVKKLADDLSAQMSDLSSPKTAADSQRLMESSQKAFEDRILDAYVQRDAERRSLGDEIPGIEGDGAELRSEIAETEIAIENSEAHIDWMVGDMSVDLSSVMRARLYQSELKAYLRGLRFQQGQHHNSETSNEA